MRFKAMPILGDSRVNIVIEGIPGLVAKEVQGFIGREIVVLANEALERRERDGDG